MTFPHTVDIIFTHTGDMIFTPAATKAGRELFHQRLGWSNQMAKGRVTRMTWNMEHTLPTSIFAYTSNCK